MEKHQLSLTLDYPPPGGKEVVVTYSYRASDPPVEETQVQVPVEDLPVDVRAALLAIRETLERRVRRLPPARTPHATVAPVLIPGVLTVAIRDQARTDLPTARLYVKHSFPGVGETSEVEARLVPEDFGSEPQVVQHLVQWASGVAWKHYEDRVRPYLHPSRVRRRRSR